MNSNLLCFSSSKLRNSHYQVRVIPAVRSLAITLEFSVDCLRILRCVLGFIFVGQSLQREEAAVLDFFLIVNRNPLVALCSLMSFNSLSEVFRGLRPALEHKSVCEGQCGSEGQMHLCDDWNSSPQLLFSTSNYNRSYEHFNPMTLSVEFAKTCISVAIAHTLGFRGLCKSLTLKY